MTDPIFSEDVDDFKRKYGDYDFNEYAFKHGASPFATSFRDIHEIRDDKVDVIDGFLKNNFLRFGIEKEKVKIKRFNEGSVTVGPAIGMIGLFIIIGV